MKLILASSSPHRLALLKSIGIMPDLIMAPDIDESPLKKEKSEHLVTRLAKTKAIKIASQTEGNAIIIAADTIVGTKAKVFDKATNNEQVLEAMKFFSGRKVHVKTAVSVVKLENGNIIKQASRLVISKVKFKRLSQEEFEFYIQTGLGLNIAGGINIQGFGEVLVQNISGSYSGIIGLPLYETMNLVRGLGYDPFKSKS